MVHWIGVPWPLGLVYYPVSSPHPGHGDYLIGLFFCCSHSSAACLQLKEHNQNSVLWGCIDLTSLVSLKTILWWVCLPQQVPYHRGRRALQMWVLIIYFCVGGVVRGHVCDVQKGDKVLVPAQPTPCWAWNCDHLGHICSWNCVCATQKFESICASANNRYGATCFNFLQDTR